MGEGDHSVGGIRVWLRQVSRPVRRESSVLFDSLTWVIVAIPQPTQTVCMLHPTTIQHGPGPDRPGSRRSNNLDLDIRSFAPQHIGCYSML